MAIRPAHFKSRTLSLIISSVFSVAATNVSSQPLQTAFLLNTSVSSGAVIPLAGILTSAQAGDTGIEQNSPGSVTFYVNTSDWADVHYQVNGGGQQNIRMTIEAGQNVTHLNGLSVDDEITYWFTYLQSNGSVTDTSPVTYTVTAEDSDPDGDSPSGVIVEAEDYANYFDTTTGNAGGEFRSDDVDIEATGDSGGGFNVGWTAAGEWLEYTVELNAGTYDVSARVASETGGAGFSLSLDGNTFASQSVVSTGGWQNFETRSTGQLTVSDSGSHRLRVNVTGGEFNLNWIAFAPSSAGESDTDNDGVSDSHDRCPNTAAGVQVDHDGCVVVSTGSIVPLYDSSTALEPAISFDRGDALVTRFADRGRDRHAKEDQFQIYDHYLSHYWTHRTAQFQIVDYVAKGGSSLEITFVTEWKLGAREFRAFYRGLNTVAEYHGNYFGGGAVVELDHGSYDYDFNKISDVGEQYRYQVIIEDYRPLNWEPSNGTIPLEIGQRMEFEASQFLDGAPEGRDNYYGTTYLYIVGQGLVPWKTKGDFADKSSEREDSYPIAEAGWLGGHTTLPYNYTHEPDNHFMQMATNLSNVNGQAFVQGRRIHHSSFIDGKHNEHVSENGIFTDVVGKAGPHYITASCAGCHERNGRAAPVEPGEPLVKWQFKVADINGNADPLLGYVLQPNNIGINDATDGEGQVVIDSWTENNGLRSPNYQFSKSTPARFSARIAPQLVGLGLLEAIPENTVLSREDVNDDNGDGISGKAQRVADAQTGETRLGRFGWKAGKADIRHQVAGAFNTDMGVTNSLFPNPDCGSSQTECGSSGVEVSDAKLDMMVKYISLLGVRAQRDLDDPSVQNGKSLFSQIGCNGCHVETMETSQFHPLAELRGQTIHPYTDLLLHDMGEGLADNLGEGNATGAEWRTTPLWGIGLSACVTGGVTNDIGGQGNEYCTPEHSYLHDGRARSIEEAILWHGGEAEASRIAFESLSASDQSAVLAFLNSL
ncbi:carbohydrate-binding protein [Alteromonas pelagimontana]|uniref:Carbohydrate-binding protein n=1 Tax=Alteromonas pelagimontana TaxID=1858656 RepID=A0A6M4MI94_9ALTE|nr:di-heme oxidoredictase family protein [Alteromonas pelagimontana]QJR82638.1 carbohydrate-binding protein [Alteromonas pelagimontana]